MKKYYVLFALTLLVCLTGCKGKKDKTYEEAKRDYVLPTLMDVSKNDTANVLKMTEVFAECLKNKNVNGALDMLYCLEGDSIKSLSPNLASQYRVTLNNIAGCTYRIERLVFFRETDSEVKLVAELFKKEAGDNRPNEIGIILKPVRQGGSWYLTLADSSDDATRTSKIGN